MSDSLVDKIDSALSQIAPMAEGQSEAAISIRQQLLWCKSYLLKQPTEEGSGPLSMALIAVREFDMWGDKPDLAALICDIQEEMKVLIPHISYSEP